MNVIVEISMEYFKTPTYQSPLEQYKWNLVRHLDNIGLDKSLFYVCFFYEYKFTVENKKTKKDIHQASRHLRMSGTNLETIKFNNI